MSAYREVIENPVTGERFAFTWAARETNGEFSSIDWRIKPGGLVGITHIHVGQQERWTVLQGVLTYRIAGSLGRALRPRQTLAISAGTPHIWRNDGPETVHAILQFRPALCIEQFFETYVALAQQGRTNQAGVPGPMQLALLGRVYGVLPPGVPLRLQRPMMAAGAWLARLTGHRSWYQPTITALDEDRRAEA
jgi:quercetin dioxygenase-like cupin family protein